MPGTSSAYAERVVGGYYLDIVPDRDALARYGLMVGNLQDIISTALGGDTVTTTVEGRERYTVNVRYPRDLRSDPQSIARDVLVSMPNGGTVPLGEVAKVELTRGPTSIRTENGQLAIYIYVDMHDRDLGSYVADAQKAVADNVQFPPGTYVQWSGQFEYLERAEAKLKIVVPVTLMIIFLLLYLNFGRLTETLIVMLSLPFALVGGLWLMWWLGFNMSVAVAVGFIALCRRRGRDRRRHADLSRPGAERDPGGAASRRPCLHARRSQRGDHAGRRRARAAEDDDRGRHHGGPGPDPVEHRRRLGDHAADRRADDRRHGLLDPADADRHPGDLRPGQGVAAAGGGFFQSRDRSEIRCSRGCEMTRTAGIAADGMRSLGGSASDPSAGKNCPEIHVRRA